MSEQCTMVTTPNWIGLAPVSIDEAVLLHSRHIPAPWDSLSIDHHRLTFVELAFLAAWRATGDRESAARETKIERPVVEKLLSTLEDLGLAAPIDTSTPEASHASHPPPQTARPVGVDERIILCSPQAWSLEPEGFVRFDHDGRSRGAADATDVWIARLFHSATTVEELWKVTEGETSLRDLVESPNDLSERVARLVAMGVLSPVAERPELLDRSNAFHNRIREGLQLTAKVKRRFRDLEMSRRAVLASEGAEDLVPVYGVVPPSLSPPLALGAIYAALRISDDARLDLLDRHPRWVTSNADLADQPSGPAVYMFSDYIWSHERNLEFSRALKAHNPDAITIHGGPDCPTYERDTNDYLDTHPYVDIAVRGEGEVTAVEVLAAIGSILAGQGVWADLAEVAGIAFRDATGVVRTPDRDRITDLNTIPSPYLDGTFAAFEGVGSIGMAIVETNRGCPYGCTFCDWGSATNSRIRKFDMDRVMAELEWCAKNEVKRVFFADANFGIFGRDVEIAAHFADLKQRYGYPQRFITNYAKNTVKHLTEIVTVLTEAGVVSEGLLSLQSLDETTLDAIRRSNIKLEKYEALAAEFRASKLPLFVDLMMGLPGQTVESLHNDLQECVDRGVLAKCHGTELLVNSPMNDPEYRTTYAVESTRPPGPLAASAAKPAFVVSTSSFTRDDYAHMHEMRRFYLLAENHGVLRYVAPLVRQRIGMHEVRFYETLRTTVKTDPVRWPWLSYLATVVPDTLAPPPSWQFMIDDLHRFLVDELAMVDDTALETALLVQHAMLPDPGRAFPVRVHLPHDYPAWLAAVDAARDAGHRSDWQGQVASLDSYGPTEMTVDDPRCVSTANLGHGTALETYNDWELDSPVSRAVAAHYTV